VRSRHRGRTGREGNSRTTPAIGPEEFILLGLEGNRFTGDIAPALAELVETGTVCLLDVAIAMKGADSEVTVLEMQE